MLFWRDQTEFNPGIAELALRLRSEHLQNLPDALWFNLLNSGPFKILPTLPKNQTGLRALRTWGPCRRFNFIK
jgi:hypothetical protein